MAAMTARLLRVFFALAVVCGTAVVAEAQTPADLAARIQTLEARIATLERRLAALEGAASEASGGSTPAKAATAELSKDLANWRRLREGMTMEQVRRILGEPVRISAGAITYWYYGRGSVDFINSKLSGWNEP